MENLLPVDVLSRWVHVGMTVVLVGGSVFLRYVLMPAAESLPEAEQEALRGRVAARWRRFVGIGVGLLLLSGLYNYLVVTRPLHAGQGLYHGLMSAKILIALVVFFLASALTGRSKALEPIRQKSKTWLTALILLAFVVVAIAGFLKIVVKPVAADTSEQTVSVDQP